MPATVSRITSCTRVDGVTPVSVADPAVRAAHPSARDGWDEGEVIETFFDDPDDAQAMLIERFAIRSRVAVALGIEVDGDLGFGVAVALSPIVPSVRVVDDAADLDRTVRVRGYAIDGGSDRDAIEVMG